MGPAGRAATSSSEASSRTAPTSRSSDASASSSYQTSSRPSASSSSSSAASASADTRSTSSAPSTSAATSSRSDGRSASQSRGASHSSVARPSRGSSAAAPSTQHSAASSGAAHSSYLTTILEQQRITDARVVTLAQEHSRALRTVAAQSEALQQEYAGLLRNAAERGVPVAVPESPASPGGAEERRRELVSTFLANERYDEARLAALKHGKKLSEAAAIARRAQAAVNVEVVQQQPEPVVVARALPPNPQHAHLRITTTAVPTGGTRQAAAQRARPRASPELRAGGAAPQAAITRPDTSRRPQSSDYTALEDEHDSPDRLRGTAEGFPATPLHSHWRRGAPDGGAKRSSLQRDVQGHGQRLMRREADSETASYGGDVADASPKARQSRGAGSESAVGGGVWRGDLPRESAVSRHVSTPGVPATPAAVNDIRKDVEDLKSLMRSLMEGQLARAAAPGDFAAGKRGVTNPREKELEDIEHEIAKLSKLSKLSTVKAKSEALKIRQAYEVARYRSKFEEAALEASKPAAGRAAARRADEVVAGDQSDSDSHSLASEKSAFDEAVRVLSINVKQAGPVTARGSYRVTATLYRNYEPVAASEGIAVNGTTGAITFAASNGPDAIVWNAPIKLVGLHVDANSSLVFELHQQKSDLAGVAHKEQVVAWAEADLSDLFSLGVRLQSVPLNTLPIMLGEGRKYAWNNARLDFYVEDGECAPGDIAKWLDGDATSVNMATSPEPGAGDVDGIPVAAYANVKVTAVQSEQYHAGEGLVVLIDSLKLLPGNVAITRVTGTYWNIDREAVHVGFEAFPLADSDHLNPAFEFAHDVGVGASALADPTCVLLLEVACIEKGSSQLKVVGYTMTHLFTSPADNGQPVLKSSARDFAINAGAFQLPLYPFLPPTTGQLTSGLMAAFPRVPCSSVLMRIMTVQEAKSARRARPPPYTNRVYDSSLLPPTPTERVLYAKYLARPFETVRSAAHRLCIVPKSQAAAQTEAASQNAQTRGKTNQKPGDKAPPKARLEKARKERLTRTSSDAAQAKPDPSSAKQAGDGADGIHDGGSDSESDFVEVEQLPVTDGEFAQWMRRKLEVPQMWSRPLLDFNFAHPYIPALGFHVAVDGAMRLGRSLMSAAIISVSPPGSFYQDCPVSDNVKVTLEYDMDSMLTQPRWLDGFQHFVGLEDDGGMCVIVDVRYLVPSTNSAAPAGWACLPVLVRREFVASGYYQLPLFQGLPSMNLLLDMKRSNDVAGTMAAAIQSSRIRYVHDRSSVHVRLLDNQRYGQLSQPSWLATEQPQLPEYVANHSALRTELNRAIKSKTYARAVPSNKDADTLIADLNESIVVIAGLQNSDPDASTEGYGTFVNA